MNLPRPKVILFDLDGTLIDSRRDIALACNHALESVGCARRGERLIATFVGDGARLLLTRALAGSRDAPPPDAGVLGAALEAFHAFYGEHAADHTVWMPFAVETLLGLSTGSLALPLGLVTNKPREATRAVLAALGAEKYFAAIVAGGPLKPDPRAIEAALDPLGVAAGDAWMVGDGPQDVTAGRAAGCPTIAVRGGFASDAELEASIPSCTIDSLAPLVAMVRAARLA